MQATHKDAYRLFHDGQIALAQMEANGIRVDVAYVKQAIKTTDKRILKLVDKLKEDEVWKVWKKRFGPKAKLSSHAQLAEVFFGQLGYQSRAKTATGKDKSDEAAFADVNHPWIKEYFKLQKLFKIKGTYLEGILKETVDGYLHPMFSLAGGKDEDEGKGGARSYRSSSQLPNFQNFPIRNEEMAEIIRKSFLPRGKKYRIVETDFSQLEVRIAECYNHDPVLKRYIKDKSTDMHRDAAAMLLMCEEKQVSKAMRHMAKNQFVFPQFYGSFYIDCARNLYETLERDDVKLEGSNKKVIDHLSKKGIVRLGQSGEREDPKRGTYEHHVKQVEDYFWNKQYKVYTEWKKSWYKQYLKRGWFPLLTGFRCVGEYRRNQVINFPVQGAAFHCLLWCIVQINKELKRKKMRSRLVGQIHDSIVGDVHDDELQDYLNICHRVMTIDLPKHYKWINVPMEMEPDVAPCGKSWHSKKPWHKENGKWQPKPKK